MGKIIERVRAREEARNERLYQQAKSAFLHLSMMEYHIKNSALRGDLLEFPGSDVICVPVIRPQFLGGR